MSNGFNRCASEPTLYTKTDQQEKIMIVCLYVDNLIFIGNLCIEVFNTTMKVEFEMPDLGIMKYFLGIQVDQSKNEIFICQYKYAKYVLRRFGMLNCKPVSTPIATGEKNK